MFLRAEQYEQIVTQLRSDRDRQRRNELRASPRVGLRVQVRLIACNRHGPASVHTAWLRDISSGGVGFVLEQQLETGTYVVVSLGRNDRTVLDVLYLVIRCERLSSGDFLIGAKFDRTIGPDELNQL